MQSGLSHFAMFIVLLSCYIEMAHTFDFFRLIKVSKLTYTNSTNKPEGSTSPPMLPFSNFKNSSLEPLQASQNSTEQPCFCSNITQVTSANQTIEANISNDDEKVANVTSVSNLTSSGNLANIDMDNGTHYIIWKHFINFTNFVVYHKYIGEHDQQKDSRIRRYLGAHKLLALFLGMAGVLACLLVIIYCIYIRQHKEDMFSHHRLYGEGFEDPVLHLDTPVDHLDFFSFRDTEITPYPTPQHKCQKTETTESKEDYIVDVSKDTLHNDNVNQVIQMGTMKYP
ncbi:Golgi-associated olfactory signaling regulator [Pyxicephalus adspersus]|uniref:Golgi-associated olfactory signaling regulator n=1 Tax=Pyxicephalus adspersus TaxID=30357 RepID=UPI003B5A2C96